MSILCRCSSCDAKFKVDEKYAGRKAKCPRCATVTEIPSVPSGGNTPLGLAGNVAPHESATPPTGATRVPPVSVKPPVAAPPPAAPVTPVFPVSDSASATGPVLPPVAPNANPLASLTAASGERRSTSRRSKKSKASTASGVWLLVGGVAVVALLAIGGGVFGVMWLLQGGGDSPLSAGESRLVLDWPADERGAALVQIDGKKRNLPGSGEVAYTLSPGDHRVVLQRRGFEPVELAVSLQAGEVARRTPEWKKATFAATVGRGATTTNEPTPVGFEGWTQRYDAALGRAAQEKKDVLMALVGSDWNDPTQHLAEQVFPDAQFHEYVDESLILVVIDLPQSQRAYEQILDSAQNAMLREEYSVTADEVPVIVMLDAQGKPYAIERNYEAGSTREVIADIDEWRRQREERDRLFAQVEALPGEERLRAAVTCVDWLRERGLTRYYGDRYRAWERIALELDPSNAAGHYEALYEANWMVRWFTAGRNNDMPQIERVVREFDQWRKQHAFQDGDRAARMHLVAAASMFQLGQREAAAQHIDDALEQNPQDQQLLVQLQTLAEVFSGELGSGTGFVVAPGYILTNYHVIEGPGRVVVLGSGAQSETPAEIVAQDKEHDMALLQVTGPAAALPPLPLSNVQAGRGARVAAFGYPLGDTLGKGLKFTEGAVSALPDTQGENMYLLDLRVNPGNSGGPLCDPYGRVIGMITAKSSISQDVDSYGMALPGDILQQFLEKSLPGWTPSSAAAPAERLEWDEVDRAVSSSVLMVVKKR